MEEAYRVFEYLPIYYQNPSQEEYILFLWNSYEIIEQKNQHTFAFFAYHMLYMSAVYAMIWKIKQHRKDEFEHALIGFSKDECKNIASANDWFIFHIINERRVFSFLKLLGFTDSDLGNFRKPVKERNDAAHSNGVIAYGDQTRLDDQIEDILKHLATIQRGSHDIIKDIFISFLEDSHDPDEREYPNPEEQINEILIRGNFLSQADLAQMLSFNITSLANRPNYAEIKRLFRSMQMLYGE